MVFVKLGGEEIEGNEGVVKDCEMSGKLKNKEYIFKGFK